MATILEELLNAFGLNTPREPAARQSARGPILTDGAPVVNVPNDPRINYYDPATNSGSGLSPQDQQLINELARAGLNVDLDKLPGDRSLKALYLPGSEAYNNPVPYEDPLLAPSATIPQVPDSYSASLQELAKKTFKHPGADAVNANTKNTGIRAVVGEDGKVTLTNVVGPDPMAYVSGVKTIQKGASSYDAEGNAVGAVPQTEDQQRLATGASGLYNMLTQAKDGDTARGIMGQLNLALAEEEAKIYQNALKMAQGTVGVPELEQQLLNEQALDKQADDYVPGAGDSPITQKIRNQLDQARGLADTEAKRMLAGNTQYRQLKSLAENAQMYATRITQMEDRKQRTIDSATERANIKEDQRRLILEEKAAAMLPQQKSRLVEMEPSLAQADDVQLMQTYDRNIKVPEFKAVLEANDTAIPGMAATGNVYAKNLLLSREGKAGIKPEETEVALNRLRALARTPKAVEKGLAAMTGLAGKELDAYIAAYKNLSLAVPGQSAETKAANAAQAASAQQEALLALYKQEVTNKFAGDVSSWGIEDPAFANAIKTAQETAGARDISTVVKAYLKDLSAEQKAGAIDALRTIAQKAASKRAGSVLQAVDTIFLDNAIQSAASKGFMEWAMDVYSPFTAGSNAAASGWLTEKR